MAASGDAQPFFKDDPFNSPAMRSLLAAVHAESGQR